MKLIIESIALFLFLNEIIFTNSERQRIKFAPIDSLDDSIDSIDPTATILVAIKVKNQEYSLPTFLATLETLKCSNKKNKCDIWIVFDHSNDRSYNIFIQWLEKSRQLFDTIIMLNTQNDQISKQKHPELDPLYFSSDLNKRAIKYALDRKFSYIFFINPDIILTNEETINILIKKRKSIVAPMLTSSKDRQSTFYILNENDQPARDTIQYQQIYKRQKIGCHKIHQVHSSFLIDLNDENMNKLLINDQKLSNLNDDIQLSINARMNSNHFIIL
jgi:hypothetical protein